MFRFQPLESEWKQSVWTATGREEYKRWWQAKRDAGGADLDAGREAIDRACWASWWTWDAGSRPFHWRWPKEYQERIRDGIRVHFKTTPPAYCVPQRATKDPTDKARVVEKLQKVRDRGYIGPGPVKSLTSFFHVPKGESDIRMVYDGTKSGLNDIMWVPRFGFRVPGGLRVRPLRLCSI